MSEKKKEQKSSSKQPFKGFPWIYVIVFVLFLTFWLGRNADSTKETDWKTFKQEMLLRCHVEEVVVVNREVVEVYIKKEKLEEEQHKEIRDGFFGNEHPGPHYKFTIGSVDYFQDQLDEAQEELPQERRLSPRFQQREDHISNILSWLLPIGLIVLFWYFMMKRMGGGKGGGGMPFSGVNKSKHKLIEGKENIEVKFGDVAGLEEAKEEMVELVDLIKHPERYKDLGARIPKGVLLTGPPGTGKTLIAKAMAGEAGVPFFSISGSDFVEMFVGVGAARVRDLFNKGKEKAPCIIFIDEIEAIGRSRNKSQSQTNDERENTLNQLLVEMDGFNSDKTVIILAATNRPDLLDNALTRPGRFDRQIFIDKPDLNSREAIFKVHLKKLTLGDDVEPRRLAELTPGFAGADIDSLCNEAALHAARKRKKQVEAEDFASAVDRVIGGLEKKNKLISPDEKERIAYHETGHALCGWYFEHADPLLKISIIPRGAAALGFTQYLPKERYLHTRKQLLDTLSMTLGGRAAEEVIFNDVSTGAQNDLERVTQMVYAMIGRYGMGLETGMFSFKELDNEYALRQPYSEETARMIDKEARHIIDEAYERALKLLQDHEDKLENITRELMKKEVLYREDFEKLIGEGPVNADDEGKK